MTAPDTVELSVVVPVSERYRDIGRVHRAYVAALDQIGRTYELIYVLDGSMPETLNDVRTAIDDENGRIRIYELTRGFGEAAALSAGFRKAGAELILTLPPYLQVAPAHLADLFDRSGDYDLLIGRRAPRTDPWINRLQSRVFHGILNSITGTHFHDLGCGVRLIRRRVVEETPIYGDQHRFLPVLAERVGFRVREVDLPQAAEDRHSRTYPAGVYPRRILDILTVFFLAKFTKKPLRFFGLVGAGTVGLGGLWMLWLISERLVLGVALADRPALLLSSLLLVLGVQVFAMGLLGELLIFAHAREVKEYAIERIVHKPDSQATSATSENEDSPVT